MRADVDEVATRLTTADRRRSRACSASGSLTSPGDLAFRHPVGAGREAWEATCVASTPAPSSSRSRPG